MTVVVTNLSKVMDIFSDILSKRTKDQQKAGLDAQVEARTKWAGHVFGSPRPAKPGEKHVSQKTKGLRSPETDQYTIGYYDRLKREGITKPNKAINEKIRPSTIPAKHATPEAVDTHEKREAMRRERMQRSASSNPHRRMGRKSPENVLRSREEDKAWEQHLRDNPDHPDNKLQAMGVERAPDIGVPKSEYKGTPQQRIADEVKRMKEEGELDQKMEKALNIFSDLLTKSRFEQQPVKGNFIPRPDPKNNTTKGEKPVLLTKESPRPVPGTSAHHPDPKRKDKPKGRKAGGTFESDASVPDDSTYIVGMEKAEDNIYAIATAAARGKGKKKKEEIVRALKRDHKKLLKAFGVMKASPWGGWNNGHSQPQIEDENEHGYAEAPPYAYYRDQHEPMVFHHGLLVGSGNPKIGQTREERGARTPKAVHDSRRDLSTGKVKPARHKNYAAVQRRKKAKATAANESTTPAQTGTAPSKPAPTRSAGSYPYYGMLKAFGVPISMPGGKQRILPVIPNSEGGFFIKEEYEDKGGLSSDENADRFNEDILRRRNLTRQGFVPKYGEAGSEVYDRSRPPSSTRQKQLQDRYRRRIVEGHQLNMLKSYSWNRHGLHPATKRPKTVTEKSDGGEEYSSGARGKTPAILGMLKARKRLKDMTGKEIIAARKRGEVQVDRSYRPGQDPHPAYAPKPAQRELPFSTEDRDHIAPTPEATEPHADNVDEPTQRGGSKKGSKAQQLIPKQGWKEAALLWPTQPKDNGKGRKVKTRVGDSQDGYPT